MLPNESVQFFPRGRILQKGKLYHFHVAEVVEPPVLIPHICQAAAHACGKIPSCLSEHDDTSSGHIFATMVSDPFHYGNGARISDGETLSHAAVDIDFAACRTVKQGISGNGVLFSVEVAPDRRSDRDHASAQTLSEIVIGFAFQPETDSV